MKTTHDLSELEWSLTGWLPYLGKLNSPIESNSTQSADVAAIPAQVPGSIQKGLLDAGFIQDWNVRINIQNVFTAPSRARSDRMHFEQIN